MILRVAIVEDSQSDRLNLEKYLARYEEETGVLIKVETFEGAEIFLGNYKPVYDVVFFDIILPYMNGMDAAEQLRKLDNEVTIIFVTDMAQYAVRGYRVNALDYFLKPVTYYDLKLRMDRICAMCESRMTPVVINIPCEGVKVLSSADVYYIEVMDKQLTYHTTKGKLETRGGGGLKKLENRLNEVGFCRCSSSYLVNLKYVTSVSGDTVTVAGDRLPLSRGMKKNFVTRLSEIMTIPDFGRGEQ